MHFVFPLLSLIAALWVFFDSQKRGYSAGKGLLWAIGVFFLLIIFLPLYLFSRRKRQREMAEAKAASGPPPLTECFYCGRGYEGQPKICPHCGQNLKF